jgi:hypothetical protein
MSGWPNLIAYWGGKPPLTKLNIIERWFRLDRWTEPNPAYVHAAAHARELVDPEYIESENSPLLFTANGGKKTGWSTTDVYDAKLEYKVKDEVTRWKFELARFGAWFVVFQVSFFVTLVIPLVARRMISGHNSEFVP